MRTYFAIPRRRLRWETLHNMLVAALILHMISLYFISVFKPETKKKEYEFFEVKVVDTESASAEKEDIKKSSITIPGSKALIKGMQDFEPAPAPKYAPTPSLPDQPTPRLAPGPESTVRAPSLPAVSYPTSVPVLGTPGPDAHYSDGSSRGNAPPGPGSGVPGGKGWGGPVVGGWGAGGTGPGGFGGGTGEFQGLKIVSLASKLGCGGCKTCAPDGRQILKNPQLLNFEQAIQKMGMRESERQKASKMEIIIKVDKEGKPTDVSLFASTGDSEVDKAVIELANLFRFAPIKKEDGTITEGTIYCTLLVCLNPQSEGEPGQTPPGGPAPEQSGQPPGQGGWR